MWIMVGLVHPDERGNSLANNKTYILVDDILAIRIECNCGVVLEGKISTLEEKLALLRVCPGCSKRWTTGKESELEVANSATSVMTFLSALNTFKEHTAQLSGLRVSLEIPSAIAQTKATT